MCVHPKFEVQPGFAYHMDPAVLQRIQVPTGVIMFTIQRTGNIVFNAISYAHDIIFCIRNRGNKKSK